MKKWILGLLLAPIASSGQAGSEIFLFDLKLSGEQIILSNGKNITNHKGYDNQPFFHPSQPLIYYSSFNDSGRSDIKYFNYQTGRTSGLTVTPEREYSPTVTPDGKFISCIIQRDNGAQDLAKYPVNGGKAEVLIDNLKVGYHAWLDMNKLLLFVLVDSNINNLHYYDLTNRDDTVIAIDPGRSIHPVPGQHAISFIQKNPGKDWLVRQFNGDTKTISTIAATLPGQENMAWFDNNIMLMTAGTKLFFYRVGKGTEWEPVTIEGDTAMMKGVTRLAVNVAHTKLALVVSE